MWLSAAAILALAVFLGGEVSAQDGYDCQDSGLMESLALQARLDPQAGGRIQSLELVCDAEICETDDGVSRLLTLVDICIGAPDDRAILGAALVRLQDTGYFSKDIEVSAKQVSGGSEVVITAKAALTVRSVSYSGNSPLLETDIEKRLQLRRGSVYVFDEALLKAQKNSIKELYKQEGYYNTRVDIIVSPVEGTKTVEVKVEITKGRELEIERVVIGGHTNLSYSRIRSLLLEPIGWLGTFTRQKLKDGMKKVLEAYRERGFYRVKIVETAIDIKAKQGLVEIRIDIDEGPRWTLRFRGNERFSAEELAQNVTFSKSGYVDNVEIAKSVEALKAYYETYGYYFAEVEARRTPSARKDEQEIVFTVEEKKRAEIRSIYFSGNTVFTSEELLAMMATKPYGLFASGGFLQRSELEADLGKIVSSYQSRGYFRATVPRWQISKTEGGSALRLVIFIEEGPETTVGNIVAVGSKELPEQVMLESIKSRAGDPLSLDRDGQPSIDAGMLLRRQKTLGYPNTTLELSCRVPQGEWEACTLPRIDGACFERETLDPLERCSQGACEDTSGGEVWCCRRTIDAPECGVEGGLQADKVDLRFDLEARNQMKISAVFIRGNFKTKDSVIWGELPFREGETFQESKVFEGQSNLRSLGLFESVTVKSIGREEDAINRASAGDRVALVVAVEESSALFWDFRLGGESRNLLEENSSFVLTAETAFVNNNVLGSGRGLQIKFKSALDLFELLDTFSDAANLDDDLLNLDFLMAFEAVFFAPRSILWRSEVALTFFYSLDLLGVEEIDLDKEEGGVRLSARKNLKEVLAGLSIQIALEQRRFTTRSRNEDTRDRDGQRLFTPLLDITKLSFNPTLDRRDSKLNPTKGYLAELSAEVAVDAGDLFDTNAAVSTAFIKSSITWSQYWPFFSNNSLTWGYGLRLGAILPLFDTESVPADELFRLGGTSTVRGFRDDGVGPLKSTFEPRGGELLALLHSELRYPLLREMDIFGAAFIDVGLLVDCRETNFDSDEPAPRLVSCLDDLVASDDPREGLRSSAGLGVRWLILGQIPLVIDYGLLLNRRFGEAFGDLHIGVGYIF